MLVHQQTLKCKNIITFAHTGSNSEIRGFHRVEAVCDVYDAVSLNQFTEVLGLFLFDSQ